MQRPGLRELADLAQVVGAVGIIVSLLYVATEVRQNTRALRASTFQAMTANAIELRSFIFNDSAFQRFTGKASETPDSLTPDEQRRWNAFAGANLRNFENMHFQHWAGMLDEEIWVAYDRLIRGLVSQPGYGRWYQAHADQFSVRFQRYMSDVLRSPRPFGPTFAPESSRAQ